MQDTKTIVVTGASSGIGRAICEQLLTQGHTLIGIARDFSQSAGEHGRFHAISIDLADLDTLPNKLHELTQAYTDIDGLVCCAGRGQFGSLEEFSFQQIHDLMDLNFTSQAYMIRALLPLMKRAGRGDVVVIGSEAALSGGRKGAIYCASKFALRGLAQSLRQECAKSGVRVTIVNPGMVKTPFFNELDFGPGEKEDNYVLPEDVANAVSLVISARKGTVFDEINLSPLKKVVQFGGNRD